MDTRYNPQCMKITPETDFERSCILNGLTNPVADILYENGKPYINISNSSPDRYRHDWANKLNSKMGTLVPMVGSSGFDRIEKAIDMLLHIGKENPELTKVSDIRVELKKLELSITEWVGITLTQEQIWPVIAKWSETSKKLIEELDKIIIGEATKTKPPESKPDEISIEIENLCCK